MYIYIYKISYISIELIAFYSNGAVLVKIKNGY